MTPYDATWLGSDHAVITGPEQVAAVLLPLHELNESTVVDVFRYREGRPHGGVQIDAGHPDRSFVLYFGEPEGGYAVEAGLPVG